MTTQTIKVGICGLGTVGQGVIALLSEGGDVLSNRVGGTIELVHVATRTPKPEVHTLGARDSRDVFDVARDPDVDAQTHRVFSHGHDPMPVSGRHVNPHARLEMRDSLL